MAEPMTPERLAEVAANIGDYLEQRAAELAEPLIRKEHRRVADAVSAANAAAARQKDLVGELRRRVVSLERQNDRLRTDVCDQRDLLAGLRDRVLAAHAADPDTMRAALEQMSRVLGVVWAGDVEEAAS